jgi:glycosyltransferase involved in cell wall biosynthesis
LTGATKAVRSLYVVVPVFNEAPNLARLLDGLRATCREAAGIAITIVFVDDGSTDGTAELARELSSGIDLTVLRHETNRGPGYAFGTAFQYLAKRVRANDLVLTMEGDNTSRTELIGAMLHRIGEGHDAVFASPYMYGGGILHTNATRVLLSHIANAIVKEFLGVHGILTVSSFFRLYRGTCLQRLQNCYGERIVERTGFESMVELVMKMMYLRMSISELPMVLDMSRRAGRSKLNTWRTAIGYLSLFRRKRPWRRRAAANHALASTERPVPAPRSR